MINLRKYQQGNFAMFPAGTMAAAISSGAIATLNSIPASLLSTVLNGGNFPICSYQMNQNGQGQTATGDSGAALIYAQFGTDWLVSGLNSEFECEYTQTSVSGAAGTLVGALNVFQILTSNRLLNWQKDTNATGVATWNGTVELREIAVPANTTGVKNIQMTSEATP